MSPASEDVASPRVEGVVRRRVAGLGMVLVAMYAPLFAWLLFMPEIWSDRRWSVLGMLPVLPGLLPGAMLADAFRKSTTSALLLSGGFSLLILLMLWHLASIGRRARLVVGLFVFGFSSIYAFLITQAWT